MKIERLLIAALLISVSVAGCGKAEDIMELMQQINKLEREKKELTEKLSVANQTIGHLRQENSTLKSELTTLADKDKKNLDHLFR